MRVEQTILKNLIYNDEYTRKVLPFLRSEYFSENSDRTVFNAIHQFVQDYSVPPTIEAVALAVKEKRNRSEEHTSELQSH